MENLILKSGVTDFVRFENKKDWNIYLKWMDLCGVRSIERKSPPTENSRCGYKKGYILSYGETTILGYSALYRFIESDVKDKKIISFQEALDKNNLTREEIISKWGEFFLERNA